MDRQLHQKEENVQQRASFGLGVTLSYDSKTAELYNKGEIVEEWKL